MRTLGVMLDIACIPMHAASGLCKLKPDCWIPQLTQISKHTSQKI